MRRCSVAALVAAFSLAGCGGGEEHPLPEGAQEITIPAGDAELEATVVGDGDRYVVFSHGASGRRDDFYALAEAFADGGFRSVAFNGRRDHRADDLRTVVAWVREEGATEVALVGGSYGGCLSVALASELDAVAVIGLSVAPTCGDLSAEPAAANLGPIPSLFVVAEDDEGFVPTAQSLADITGSRLIVVEGNAHGTGTTNEHPEIIPELVEFVDGGER